MCLSQFYLHSIRFFSSIAFDILHTHTYIYIFTPRTTEAAIIIYTWWKISFWRGPTQKRSFLWWDGSSKLWCFERNGVLLILQEAFPALRTHNSCVQLENFYQKNDKLKRHTFPTKRRKCPTKRRKSFWLFSMHIWTLTCYISAHVPEGVQISKKSEKCKNGSWHGKNPVFWLRWQKLLKLQQFL